MDESQRSKFDTGSPQADIDLSNDFLEMTDSSFAERLDELRGRPLVLKVPVEVLGANVFDMRLKRFLDKKQQGLNRKVVIVGSKQQKELFWSRYPGTDWEATD